MEGGSPRGNQERPPGDLRVATVRSRILAQHGGLVVTVHHSTRSPSEADWAANLDTLANAMRDFRRVRQITFTDGEGPNAGQRQLAAQKAKDSGAIGVYKCAVVSSSAVTRGIMTALGWLGLPGLKPFSPRELLEALLFLDLDHRALDALALAAQSCADECGGPNRAMAGLPLPAQKKTNP